MKNEKGITLVSLIITIVLLAIIAGTTTYISYNRFKINNVKKMQNDIELLNDKISTYYIKYGGIPISEQYTYSSIDFDTNVNDDGTYYIIDLSAIGNITLNYGEEGYKYPNTSDDVYIVNNKTHTVYYVKGVEYTDGNLYYSLKTEDNTNSDNIPPTKPQINYVSGDKIDDLNYKTNVTLEFVPGKDNWSGVEKTTYIINGNEEKDISTLENNKYEITEKGIYEITVKTYDNNNNCSEISKTITVGQIQQVEYLESTGTEYIDTDIKASNSTGIDISFCALEYVDRESVGQTTCFIFGGESGWQSASFDFQAGLYGLVYNTTKVGTVYSTETLSDQNTEKHNLKIIDGQYYFDDELQYDLSKLNTSTWSSNTSIVLFGIKRNGNIQRKDASRIYSCKIYDGDLLARDFIPVLDENEIACLYDKVEGKFYYNKGTGTFKTNLDE